MKERKVEKLIQRDGLDEDGWIEDEYMGGQLVKE